MPSTDSTVVRGSSSDGTDYDAVEIPATDPADYSWRERRAELLQQIRDVGHPSALNQTELADRYGCSQQQISKDFDRLAAYVREHAVDRDRRALTVDAVIQRSIQGMLEEGDYRKAARTAVEWDEWLREFERHEHLAEKVDRLTEELNIDT